MEVIYYLCFFLLWWSFAGYILFLYLLERNKRSYIEREELNSIPHFSIIVPIFNEKRLIEQKIKNLKDLSYKNYTVYFADASTDETKQIISENIGDLSNFHLISCAQKGRSFQLNEVLSLISPQDLVLITDVDALLEKDCLEKIARVFLSNERIGLVGGWTEPVSRYRNEIVFWHIQNTLRALESSVGHCSTVSGACYAFRREVVDRIPQSVWAEDIYLPFLINTKGYQCIYHPQIYIKEVRGPSKFKNFIKLKIRKGQDNIKELIRFFPHIHRMRFPWILIYLTRFLQIIIFPILVLPFLLLLFFQDIHTLVLSFILFLAGFLLQSVIFSKMNSSRPKKGEKLRIFLLSSLILFLSVWGYLFKRTKIGYCRIEE